MDLAYYPINYRAITEQLQTAKSDPSVPSHASDTSLRMAGKKPRVVPLNYVGVKTIRPIFPGGKEYTPNRFCLPFSSPKIPERLRLQPEKQLPLFH
jgi:hypothetical protein